MADIRINLETKLGQKLLITPQMKQSLKILQLPYLELVSELSQILEENPVLEQSETSDIQEGNQETTTDDFLKELQKVNWEDYFSDPLDGLSYKPDEEDEVNFDKFIGKSENLYDHLLFQLHILGLDDYKTKIGEFIIGNIDENGYLTLLPEEISKFFNNDIETVEKVLLLIKEFEPAGVASSTLTECIIKQLKNMEIDPYDIKVAEEMLERFNNELIVGDFKKIADEMSLSLEYITEIVDFIKRVDPKPGLQYSSNSRFITPDVYITGKDGEYEVFLNENDIPHIKINKHYIKMLKNNSLDAASREYIEDKLKNAIWFLKSMNQRKKAILKVVEALVEFQRDFLDKGIKFLKPLKLKDIAKVTDLHESTVSRVTSNKYALCKYGVIELKSFFIKSLPGYDGGEVSVTNVKDLIKSIIENESEDRPHSDQKIVEILLKKGIKIARRTVAKYRDELNIPGAAIRKKTRR
jgi:RNA polymerase sigma-54 factor